MGVSSCRARLWGGSRPLLFETLSPLALHHPHGKRRELAQHSFDFRQQAAMGDQKTQIGVLQYALEFFAFQARV